MSPEVGIIEVVDSEGNSVQPGEIGEVVCTGLHNTLQPLIRYRIGDVARLAVDQNCACWRQMPILESIEGRFEDLCYTADGREMLRFDTVFKGIESIREAQVVQESIERFTINVVPASGFGEADIEKLRKNMRSHAGDVRVEVKTVDRLTRSLSGKFRAVVCNLPKEEKRRLRLARSA